MTAQYRCGVCFLVADTAAADQPCEQCGTADQFYALPVIGKEYRFNYPPQFTTLPDYTARAGSVVTVVAIQEPGHEQGETTYLVRAADGWEGTAFESELEESEGA